MGDLAAHLGVFYQTGTSRGDYSLLSSMEIEKAEFFTVFGRTVNDLILRHRLDLDRKLWRRAAGPSVPDKCFVPHYRSRTRWVDGTPEYSFHVYGLRKLFPDALFVHMFRDVTSVIRSMLHFHHLSGQRLVANEEEAYRYWLGAVRQCLLAERAYGPGVVFRLRHSDLVARPEAALRALFDFLDETYAPECLQPLAQRINSSNVPPNFKHQNPATDSAIVEEAHQLSSQLEQTPQISETSSTSADELEAKFNQRVQYIANWPQERSKQEEAINAYKGECARLQSEFESATTTYQAEQSRRESWFKTEQSRLESACREFQFQLQEAAEDIAELTEQLQRQLRDTKNLVQFLDDTQRAAVRLRSSRRWKLANPGALIRALGSGTTKVAGYGDLDKIVTMYSQWRASHPEVANVEEKIRSLQSQTVPDTPSCRT